MSSAGDALFPTPEPTAWGHSGRYYAGAKSSPDHRGAEQRLTHALNAIAPATEAEVKRAFTQWNTPIRDCLRREMALRLSTQSDAQSVPVRIVGGMPGPFEDAVAGLDGLEWLLLERPTLVELVRGTEFMERSLEQARRQWGEDGFVAQDWEVRSVRVTAQEWLERLDEQKALQQILGIREDVLGAYFFKTPEIRLYWVVIGTISRALGIPVHALTFVVLAHELAHAYTHLGKDIDDRKWDIEAFAGAELSLVEGLAQYYTRVVCERLRDKLPEALTAFATLLEHQAEPYRASEDWAKGVEARGELLRGCLLECRVRNVQRVDAFAKMLAEKAPTVRPAS